MTPKGEQLTQEGEISERIFSIHRKLSPGFSAHSLTEETNQIGFGDQSQQGLKMIFVLKGMLKGFTGQSKKKVFLLRDHQHNLILANNDVIWQVESEESDIVCLEIDFSFLSRYLPEDHSGLINLKKGLQEKETVLFSSQNLSICPEILVILNSLKTSTHSGFCEKLFLESKVLELLMFQASQFEQLTSLQPSRQLREEEMNQMQEVKAILIANVATQFSLRALAHMVGTNEFNLKRNFKIAFGTTVYGYLNQYKMEMAKTMLLEKNINIAEIATKTGYKYATHFSSAFKKHFGYLPNQLKSGKLSLLIFINECASLFEPLLLVG